MSDYALGAPSRPSMQDVNLDMEEEEEEKSLGVGGMVGVGFFWVSGGLYGNEALLAAAPPGVIITCLLAVSALYAVPSAMMTGELATAIPEDGGGIVWVERAFGYHVGMHNAWWTYVSWVFDCSLYPVLAAEYAFAISATSINKTEGLFGTNKNISAYNGAGYAPATVTARPTAGVTKDVLGGGERRLQSDGTATPSQQVTAKPSQPKKVDATESMAMEADEDEVDPHKVGKGLFAMGMVLVITLVKLRGLDVIVKLSTAMTVISLAPCIVWVLVSLPSLKPSNWFVFEGEVDWALLISWTLWLNAGYIGLGALAGQVNNPQYTYPRATFALLVISTCVNVVPVLIAVSLDPNSDHYAPGYFGVLAGGQAGEWLQWCFKVGAFFSMIGLYNAQVLQSEFTMVFLLERCFPELVAHLEGGGSWLFKKQEGVAPIHTLFNSLVVMMLAWLPYQTLVQCSMLLASLTIIIIVIAFLVLRWSRPELERPFRMPCTPWWLVALSLVPVLAMGFLVITMDVLPDSMYGLNDVWWTRVVSGAGTIISGLVAHGLWRATHATPDHATSIELDEELVDGKRHAQGNGSVGHSVHLPDPGAGLEAMDQQDLDIDLDLVIEAADEPGGLVVEGAGGLVIESAQNPIAQKAEDEVVGTQI